jgi:hypothetical protein
MVGSLVKLRMLPFALSAWALVATLAGLGCGIDLGISRLAVADPADPRSKVPSDAGTTAAALFPPPATGCGDTSANPAQCGFCGHSCQGGTCSAGHCVADTIVASSSLLAFVTDGTTLFYIDGQGAFACPAAGPPTTCRELVTVSTLAARGWTGNDWEDGADIPLEDLRATIEPTALTMAGDRVFIADQSTKSVLSCPTQGRCNESSLAILRADDGQSLGSALTMTPSSLVWTQGAAIRSGPLPAPGSSATPRSRRSEADTADTARLAADTGNVFWLSGHGLFHAADVGDDADQWFDGVASDVAIDPEGAFLATAQGLFHVDRPTKTKALIANGSFSRVAIDERGVVVARDIDGTNTAIDELRQGGLLLDLAVVPGRVDSLAVAGNRAYYTAPDASGRTVYRVPR